MVSKLDALALRHDLVAAALAIPEQLTYSHRLLIWGVYLFASALYLRQFSNRCCCRCPKLGRHEAIGPAVPVLPTTGAGPV